METKLEMNCIIFISETYLMLRHHLEVRFRVKYMCTY